MVFLHDFYQAPRLKPLFNLNGLMLKSNLKKTLSLEQPYQNVLNLATLTLLVDYLDNTHQAPHWQDFCHLL